MGIQRGSSVTIRQDLTDMAEEINFDELKLVGDRIAMTTNVDEVSGYYPVLSRESRMKVMDTRRHADGSYARSQWEWDDDSYITREHGFEEPIDNVNALKDAKYISHEETSMQLATEGMMLGRESRVAEALFNTTVWSGKTTSITNEWDDPINATPWAVVNTAAKAIRGVCGASKSALSLILSDDLIEYVMLTDEIKNGFKYSGSYTEIVRGTIEVKAGYLASYLGVKEVIPTQAIYDTAKLASAASIGKFWTNDYAFLGKLVSAEGLKAQGVIKQLNWSSYSSNYILESYEEPTYNRNIIRAREFRGTKVNTDYGHLLTNMKTTVDGTTGI